MPTKKNETITPRIGWIGTGVMGVAMCGHILDRGYTVTAFNRTKAKAQPLLERGAAWAQSPRAIAERSEIVFTMVGFPRDVREVYFGDHGLLNGARMGTVFVDMTTTEPSLAREIYTAAKAKGVAVVDAPVSGGDIGARNATLSIMVGGDAGVVEKLRTLFESMGKTIVHQGGPGSGQHAKLCNQILIAGTMIGICESLLYGYKAGLDLETMLRSVGSGAAGGQLLHTLAPRILQRDFAPGFYAEHFLKDLGIALAEAERMKLRLPGLQLAHELYCAVQEQGHGKCGTQALMLALEKMSGVEIKQQDGNGSSRRKS